MWVTICDEHPASMGQWLKEMICRHLPGLAESRCFRCFATSVLKILKGKCKGLTYEQCLAQQPQYCTWLLRRGKSVASEYQGLVGFLRVRLQASEEAVLANLEETSKGKMSRGQRPAPSSGVDLPLHAATQLMPQTKRLRVEHSHGKSGYGWLLVCGYANRVCGLVYWSQKLRKNSWWSWQLREAMSRFVGSRFQQTLGSPCLTLAEILFCRCAVKTNLLCKWTAWCRLSISKCSRCAVPSGYVW